MPLAPDTISWSPWLPLFESWKNTSIPLTAGLYRIRRAGGEELDYIGQTGAGGMTLRKRLSMLKGVWDERMPYRDPHTAGPGLWALRQRGCCAFEVSVATVQGGTVWRKGLECFAILQYRLARRTSPTLNFGRMPAGYQMSTSNNAALVAAGKRIRGGSTRQVLPCHSAGIPPAGTCDGSPQDAGWCGHKWSDWTTIGRSIRDIPTNTVGLYRLRTSEDGTLQYVRTGPDTRQDSVSLPKGRHPTSSTAKCLCRST